MQSQRYETSKKKGLACIGEQWNACDSQTNHYRLSEETKWTSEGHSPWHRILGKKHLITTSGIIGKWALHKMEVIWIKHRELVGKGAYSSGLGISHICINESVPGTRAPSSCDPTARLHIQHYR